MGENHGIPEDEVVQVLKEAIPAPNVAHRLRTRPMQRSKGRMAPTEDRRREENAESAIEWLRTNEASVCDMSDDAVKVLASMTGVPMPPKRTTRTRKKAMKDAID